MASSWFHLQWLRQAIAASRDALIATLKNDLIPSSFHWDSCSSGVFVSWLELTLDSVPSADSLTGESLSSLSWTRLVLSWTWMNKAYVNEKANSKRDHQNINRTTSFKDTFMWDDTIGGIALGTCSSSLQRHERDFVQRSRKRLYHSPSTNNNTKP